MADAVAVMAADSCCSSSGFMLTKNFSKYWSSYVVPARHRLLVGPQNVRHALKALQRDVEHEVARVGNGRDGRRIDDQSRFESLEQL